MKALTHFVPKVLIKTQPHGRGRLEKPGGVINAMPALLSLMKHLPKSMVLCWVASANEEKAIYCFSGKRLTHHKKGPFA